MIKSVIFDIDNTLYNYDKAHETAMEKLVSYGESALDFTPEEMRDQLFQVNESIKDRLGTNTSTIHNRLIRFQRLLENSGKNLERAVEMYHIYWDTLIETMVPEQGVRALIQALRGTGISIGIGTDMTAYIQYKKLEKLKILDQISYIVTSEEAGAEKPSAEFFELCLEKAGCSAGECIFIGDSLEKDVRGADENGIYGVWYHPAGESTGGTYPVIRSFEECLTENGICIGTHLIR